MPQLSKKELLDKIEAEMTRLDCLQKDYRERFCQMKSEEIARRQSAITASMRYLQLLNEELYHLEAEEPSVGEMVERLIFETNKIYAK